MIEYLRDGKYRLAPLEAMGLPPISGQTIRDVELSRHLLFAAVLNGDKPCCCRIAIDLDLAEHCNRETCDEVFAAVFRELNGLSQKSLTSIND
ncbi:hypothetical protein Pla144_13110 [Bythopirellula polymerisocia]|uniref:Uncharacterized protein n=1 Tax=Bythopirellula polymerisocia TaxID=2528003 RepID=A0A5C6D074_9BACT|nr:hypothetical protein Pla144_13110 [Bythopirellula polymerisocia]